MDVQTANEREGTRMGEKRGIVDRRRSRFFFFSVLVFQHLPIRPADFFLKPLIFALFSSHG
jgi:hypothetical protein